MKILLVHPPPFKNASWVRQGRCITTARPGVRVEFPIFMAYAASILRENGHSVTVVDATAEEITSEEVQQRIKTISPDAVIVESVPHTFEGDQRIAELTKQIDREICTVYYGWQPTARPVDVLNNTDIDFAVRGEPEKTLEDLLGSLEKGKSIEDVKGLSFKKNGEVKHNAGRPLLMNLDELPIPARDLFPLEKYCAFPLGRMTTVSAARGCPYPCIYCSTQIMDGGILRARQPKLVVDEIEEIVHKFNIRTIFFYADNFTLWSDKKIVDFSKELSDRKLHIRWLTNSRIDTLPSDNALKQMARTGCFLIAFGVESGSLKMLETMKKAKTKSECERYVEKIKPNIERTKKAGILTKVNMLVGFQGENQETIRESVNLIKEAAPDLSIHFYRPSPNPGSVWGTMAEERGLIPPDGKGLKHDVPKMSLDICSAVNNCEPSSIAELQTWANNAVKMSDIKKVQLGLKIFSHFARKKDWDVFLNTGKILLKEKVHIMDVVDSY